MMITYPTSITTNGFALVAGTNSLYASPRFPCLLKPVKNLSEALSCNGIFLVSRLTGQWAYVIGSNLQQWAKNRSFFGIAKVTRFDTLPECNFGVRGSNVPADATNTYRWQEMSTQYTITESADDFDLFGMPTAAASGLGHSHMKLRKTLLSSNGFDNSRSCLVNYAADNPIIDEIDREVVRYPAASISPFTIAAGSLVAFVPLHKTLGQLIIDARLDIENGSGDAIDIIKDCINVVASKYMNEQCMYPIVVSHDGTSAPHFDVSSSGSVIALPEALMHINALFGLNQDLSGAYDINTYPSGARFYFPDEGLPTGYATGSLVLPKQFIVSTAAADGANCKSNYGNVPYLGSSAALEGNGVVRSRLTINVGSTSLFGVPLEKMLLDFSTVLHTNVTNGLVGQSGDVTERLLESVNEYQELGSKYTLPQLAYGEPAYTETQSEIRGRSELVHGGVRYTPKRSMETYENNVVSRMSMAVSEIYELAKSQT